MLGKWKTAVLPGNEALFASTTYYRRGESSNVHVRARYQTVADVIFMTTNIYGDISPVTVAAEPQ